MASSKRKKYLIDKPFQLGFISKYVVIIIVTIICVFCLTVLYYWIFSFVGDYKLDRVVQYQQQELMKYEKKQIYSYEKERIEVYADNDASGQKVYRCYRIIPGESTKTYNRGDIIDNIDEKSLIPKIGPKIHITTFYYIVLWPMAWTCLSLVIIIAIYSLFFSHRMAGPIYRLRVSLSKMLDNDFSGQIKVRKKDFFSNMADQLEELRKNILSGKINGKKTIASKAKPSKPAVKKKTGKK
jgi:methyl-accepting chemotaxis protein